MTKKHYGKKTQPFDLFRDLPVTDLDTPLTIFLREDIIKRMFRVTAKGQVLKDIEKSIHELQVLREEYKHQMKR